MIEIKTHTTYLRFRYPFRIAHGERLGTDVVFVVLEWNGLVGFGEATLPPYLGISAQQVVDALNRPGIKEALALNFPDEWFSALRQIIPDLMPALAALDMARWQIHSLMNNQPVSVALGAHADAPLVQHTFTLGVSDVNEMKKKIDYAASEGFTLFKLKLDGLHDEEMLRNFRSLSDSPFAVDANQAWKTIDQALRLVDFLESNECVLIEQPFHKGDRELSFQLRESTVVPVIADEACQQIDDLFGVLDAFDGVNVKLQKCGGITPAFQQLKEIRLRGKKALIGCMSESSVGCGAAEELTFLCDWADLDGPFLNANNDELCKKIGYSL